MIINSLLDTDLYKLTMMQAVLQLYPTATAGYKFVNRRKEDKFSKEFFNALQQGVNDLCELRLTNEEYNALEDRCPYFTPSYLAYLKNYRFKREQVSLELSRDGDLSIEIDPRSPWHESILWEVPLMALISELYFRIDDDTCPFEGEEVDIQRQNLYRKVGILSQNFCEYSEFGTRRRRSLAVQDFVVQHLSSKFAGPGFNGTSNVHLGLKYDVPIIGTQAHEWVMAHSALASLQHANRYALEAWLKVYNGQLGIALPDTFGTDAFLRDFTPELARVYDGVRQDSGVPMVFAEKMIKFYESIGIDPRTKKIVFSDSLTAKVCDLLQHQLGHLIKCGFGIGTHLTNDFCTRALNMVIKMTSLNGHPVVKVSDDPAKAIGDRDALRVAMWTHFGIPLDA